MCFSLSSHCRDACSCVKVTSELPQEIFRVYGISADVPQVSGQTEHAPPFCARMGRSLFPPSSWKCRTSRTTSVQDGSRVGKHQHRRGSDGGCCTPLMPSPSAARIPFVCPPTPPDFSTACTVFAMLGEGWVVRGASHHRRALLES